MQPGLSEIRSTALWHLHEIDPERGHFVLRQIEEAQYRQASFLDQRIEKTCSRAFKYPLQHLESLFPQDKTPSRPSHYIFHIGHCGSTLLSRALSSSPAIFPVREPLTLRTLAKLFREPGAGSFDHGLVQQLAPTVLRGFGRAFSEQQITVVKATSTCNNLAPAILSAQPQARAIGMYVRLETYLAGMLGKLESPRDLRGHLPTRHEDWKRLQSDARLDSLALSEAQCAVLAWLTGMHDLLAAAQQFPDRFLLLDFESLLEAPAEVLEKCAGFIDMASETSRIQQSWEGISSNYSKLTNHPYTPADRQRTLDRGRKLRADDIGAGLAWAEELMGPVKALDACREYF